MLKERRERQQKIDLVILEEMIPQDHLLRKVEQALPTVRPFVLPGQWSPGH